MKRLLLLLLLSSPAWAQSTYASDTFTDTDATLLENHTPTLGTSWTKTACDSTGVTKINSNTVYGSTAGTDTLYIIGVASTNADYTVTATFAIGNSAHTSMGTAIRADTSACTFYGVRWNGSVWLLSKFVTGTGTTLANTYSGDVPTTPATVALAASGTTITVTINGTQRYSVTDSAISAAGRAAVLNRLTQTATTSYLDDWSASQASSSVPRHKVTISRLDGGEPFISLADMLHSFLRLVFA